MQPETDVTKATQLRPSVAAVVRDGQGRILLQRRSDNGLWGLPGGSVEIGESVTQAIIREVREETGLSVRVDRLIGVYSDPRLQVVRYPDGKVVHYVSSLFSCTILGGCLETCDETLPACPRTLSPCTASGSRTPFRDATRPSSGRLTGRARRRAARRAKPGAASGHRPASRGFGFDRQSELWYSFGPVILITRQD
jgi:ADP-ribose pyrophosphatase YjhB (NUDIX family)